MNDTIGVLLPQSKEFPKLGKEFLNGVRLALDANRVDFKVEGIGFANNAERVIDAIEKLSNQNELSCITGILGHRDLSQILDHIERIDQRLIYTDLGATKPLDLSGRSGIFCNSLDLYGATGALGRYFLDQGLLNVATSTCYYESGYGFTDAMHRALYRDNKGRFAGHFITPLHPRDNEAQLLSEFVSATSPDALFAFYNGTFAKEHAEFLAESKVYKHIPLYTLPFTVTTEILNAFPGVFHSVRFVSSWLPEDINTKNVEFILNYTKIFGEKPSIFAVLGYENGLLIKHNLKTQDFDTTTIKSPRGDLVTEAKANRTFINQRLWEIHWNGNSYEHTFLQNLDTTNIHDDPVREDNSPGWHNAYLCV